MKPFVDVTALALLTALAGAVQAIESQAGEAYGRSGCKHHADLTGAAEIAGAKRVVVAAAAGDLKVIASAGAKRLDAQGSACAPSAALLAGIALNVRRDGDVIYVQTRMPDESGGGWKYDSPTLDLSITLPDSLPMDITDSSGDVRIENVAALKLTDSSGDILVRGTRGAVDINDSSGDIEVVDSGADVVIGSDSSGDIVIDRTRGNVDVVQDSSGDIRLSNVGGNAHVGVDSSGEIVARDVGGSFTVDHDGSGDISYNGVHGAVTIPEEKRR